MAVRSKPQQAPAADERRIDALIEKGGSVATEVEQEAPQAAKPSLLQLRLPPELVKRIDRARLKRTVPPSRHAWMLEAILDKLSAEE